MMIKHNKNRVTYILMGIFLTLLATMILPSCTHESLILGDPNPIDTTGNPIDTIGNPLDTSTGTPCDTNVVYFSKQILPILVSNCAKSGCHDAITHKEGIVLDNFQNVIGSRIVKAFDANRSKMIEVMKTNDSDDRMPPAPNQKMNSAQIALISKWIAEGAKDLTCDESSGQCVTTNVSYSGFVVPLLTTYCVGCHSGGLPSGGISLNNYNGVKAVATSGKLYGAISWTSGTQFRMPQGSSKLSQCTIDKIKGWIDEGAPNN